MRERPARVHVVSEYTDTEACIEVVAPQWAPSVYYVGLYPFGEERASARVEATLLEPPKETTAPEGSQRCPTCGQAVPLASLQRHAAFCERNNAVCPVCHRTVRQVGSCLHVGPALGASQAPSARASGGPERWAASALPGLQGFYRGSDIRPSASKAPSPLSYADAMRLWGGAGATPIAHAHADGKPACRSVGLVCGTGGRRPGAGSRCGTRFPPCTSGVPGA
jgi:hypothetical protein